MNGITSSFGRALWFLVGALAMACTMTDEAPATEASGGIGRTYVERRASELVRIGPTGEVEASAPLPVNGTDSWPSEVTAVSADGRWVAVVYDDRNIHQGAIVDLSGQRQPVFTGGCEFSPGGQRALCSGEGIYAPLEVIDLASGRREQLGGFAGAAWVDDATVVVVRGEGEGDEFRLTAFRRGIFPLGTETRLATEGISFETTWSPGNAVRVPFDPFWWSLATGRPPVSIVAGPRRTCVANADLSRLACTGTASNTVVRSSDLYSVHTYPSAGRIDVIDTGNARVRRRIERRDCVLTPIQFLASGELRATCVPLTREAMGRSTEVLRVDFPRWREVQALEQGGFDVLIDPSTGAVTDLPRRLPATWILV